MKHSPTRISVVGLGNVLLGDDGFGPLTVEMFRCAYKCGANVDVVDLGTPGLDLAQYMCDKDLVLIVGSVDAKEKPGTLCTYCEADLLSHRAQLRFTAHSPGIQESLAQLRLAGHAPAELVVVGVVPESCNQGDGLSASVLSATWDAVDNIARLLAKRDIHCRRQHAPAKPNLWWLSRIRPQLATSG